MLALSCATNGRRPWTMLRLNSVVRNIIVGHDWSSLGVQMGYGWEHRWFQCHSFTFGDVCRYMMRKPTSKQEVLLCFMNTHSLEGIFYSIPQLSAMPCPRRSDMEFLTYRIKSKGFVARVILEFRVFRLVCWARIVKKKIERTSLQRDETIHSTSAREPFTPGNAHSWV